MSDQHLHLAVALDGAGWHPASWREPDARPGALLSPRYWVDVVREAERGLVDLVTIEDSYGLQSSDPLRPDDRTDQVRGRLDATLIAARVAPVTQHVGVVPTVLATYTEPFHASTQIATLDYASKGRAGVRVQISPRAADAALTGRREIPEISYADLKAGHYPEFVHDLFAEAEEYVDAVRRLWDSWEDDAEIRDAATGRFIDVDRLHYVDFSGRFFDVKGPSITPRPVQGQPIVFSLAHAELPYRFAARTSDVVAVTPFDREGAHTIVDQVRAAQSDAGRAEETLHVFGDVVVLLDDSTETARARKARLDERDGQELRSDALVFAGTATDLADLLLDWKTAGLTGFRLRPATIPHDLRQITEALVPELQRRGAYRTSQPTGSLRDRLGLARPANRYASA